jgi:hypothetical protein
MSVEAATRALDLPDGAAFLVGAATVALVLLACRVIGTVVLRHRSNRRLAG